MNQLPNYFLNAMMRLACVDPESFVRGGPTWTRLFFFFFKVYEGREKRAIIGPPAKRSMAFRGCADDGPTLNAGLVVLRFLGDPEHYC